MKKTLITPIIGVGIALAPHLYASEKVIGRAEGYEIVIRTEADGQSSVAQLREGDKLLKTSEDLFELINSAPSNVKKQLLIQIVDSEISKEGGAAKYQQKINVNLKKYGKDFYRYMGQDIRNAYAERGVQFDGTNIEPEPKKGTTNKTSTNEEEVSTNEELRTSIEWE